MTNPAKTKLMTYIVALAIASAAAVTLNVASAEDNNTVSKSQERHPAIAAIADASGARSDMVSTNMPDGTRDVIITLPDGRLLIQRYYPSGYNVIFKPEPAKSQAIAAIDGKPAADDRLNTNMVH